MPSEDRPNILWLLSDQHRADSIGVADGVVQSPNLDALAAEGTRFDAAYCQGPLCVPARASLLTQRYVAEHGVEDNTWRGGREGLPTTVQSIRDAGYHTSAIGKMHLYKYPPDVADGEPIMREHGFVEVDEMLGKYGNAFGRSPYTDYLAEQGHLDAYREFLTERNPHSRPGLSGAGLVGKPHWVTDPAPMPEESHPDRWLGERAANWIRGYSRKQPFFLWVGFPGPHDPWDAPQSYVDRYRDADIPMPASTSPPEIGSGRFGELVASVADYCSSASQGLETIRTVRKHYYASVSMIDDAIGSIFDALKARGLWENTWIVYSSDHGEMLGEHGLFTKTLFYEPSVRVPLIVRAPGGGHPRTFDGMVQHVDLSATLCDIAGGEPVPDSDGRSFAKVLEGSDRWQRPVVRSECEGFGMWRTERYKIVVDERSMEPVQLFDLVDDPLEDTNLVSEPAAAEVVRSLMDEFVQPDLERAFIRAR